MSGVSFRGVGAALCAADSRFGRRALSCPGFVPSAWHFQVSLHRCLWLPLAWRFASLEGLNPCHRSMSNSSALWAGPTPPLVLRGRVGGVIPSMALILFGRRAVSFSAVSVG
eukprot:1354639-Pyramimonas_sp.AAC.1